MKIVIDVDKLLQEGRVTDQEHGRLTSLAVEETGSLAFNILIGFGVIATVAGASALLPSGPTAMVLGFALAAAGVLLAANYAKEWGLLGSMLLLVGSLTAAGGIIFLTDGGFVGFLIVTDLCLIASALAKSGLLAAMSVLSLSATVGAMTVCDSRWRFFDAYISRISPVIRHVSPSLNLFKQKLSELSAADDQGKAVPVDGPEATIELPIRSGLTTAELEIPLLPPPRDVIRLGRLKGKLTALLPGLTESFRFERVAAGFSGEKRIAGVVVKVDDVRQDNGAWEFRVRACFDQLGDALESHRGWKYENEAYLEGADGRRIDFGTSEAIVPAKGDSPLFSRTSVPIGETDAVVIFPRERLHPETAPVGIALFDGADG